MAATYLLKKVVQGLYVSHCVASSLLSKVCKHLGAEDNS